MILGKGVERGINYNIGGVFSFKLLILVFLEPFFNSFN